VDADVSGARLELEGDSVAVPGTGPEVASGGVLLDDILVRVDGLVVDEQVQFPVVLKTLDVAVEPESG